MLSLTATRIAACSCYLPHGLKPSTLSLSAFQARIDQLRAVVAITKCAPRTFGAEHWKELQHTLAGWREAAEMAQTALTEAATGAARPAPGGLAGGPASAPVRA